MTANQAILEKLNGLYMNCNMTRSALSRGSGLPRSTLNDMLDGKTVNIGVENIIKITGCFGITLREFFDDPVFDKLDR